MPSTPHFRFFDLPKELRDVVYDYLDNYELYADELYKQCRALSQPYHYIQLSELGDSKMRRASNQANKEMTDLILGRATLTIIFSFGRNDYAKNKPELPAIPGWQDMERRGATPPEWGHDDEEEPNESEEPVSLTVVGNVLETIPAGIKEAVQRVKLVFWAHPNTTSLFPYTSAISLLATNTPKVKHIDSIMRAHHTDLTEVMQSNETAALLSFLYSTSDADDNLTSNFPTVKFTRGLEVQSHLYRHRTVSTYPNPENRVVFELEVKDQSERFPGEDGCVVKRRETGFEYFRIVNEEAWADEERVRQMVEDDPQFASTTSRAWLQAGNEPDGDEF